MAWRACSTPLFAPRSFPLLRFVQVHLEDRTEAELEQLTRDAILSALPPENQPLPTAEPALEREVPAAAKVGTPA